MYRGRYSFGIRYFRGAFQGWAYQDFSAGTVTTSVTISDNENGSGYGFETDRIASGSAVVVQASDPAKKVYTGTSRVWSTKVSVSAHTGTSVTLSGVPHSSWGDVRIYYWYEYDRGMPIDYEIPTKNVAESLFAEIQALFITEEELADGSKAAIFSSLNNTSIGGTTPNSGSFTSLSCTSFSGSSLTFEDLTASRLVATDSSKGAVSSDLNSWVTGTANQVAVTDDADGTITLSLPTDITIGTLTCGDVTSTGNIAATGTLSCGAITSVGNGGITGDLSISNELTVTAKAYIDTLTLDSGSINDSGGKYSIGAANHFLTGASGWLIGGANQAFDSTDKYAFGANNTLSGQDVFLVGFGSTISGQDHFGIGGGLTISGTIDNYAFGSALTVDGTSECMGIGYGFTNSTASSIKIGVDATPELTISAGGVDVTGDLETTGFALIDGDIGISSGRITSSSGAITFVNENLSTIGTLSAGAITGTSLRTSPYAITSGSEISYKTAAITPSNVGIIEVVSNAANQLGATIESGVNVEAYYDPSQAVNFQYAGSFFNKTTATLSSGMSTAPRGLFGGCQTAITNSASAYLIQPLMGLQFSCFNNANFDGGTAKSDVALDTYGISVTSYLGYDGKTISNQTAAENWGGYFNAILDGTYNSSPLIASASYNYGIVAKTTDSLTNASGDITSYALYIDALTGSTKAGTGVITSWGLYEANGRDNALVGNTRIGSTTAPTVALDVTGDIKTTGFLELTQKAGTATDGDLWNDSTQEALQTFVSGIEQTLVGVIFTQTADQTIANTTTETTMFGSGVGTLTLPANFWTVGKTIRLEIHGDFADTGNPTAEVQVYYGATSLIDSGAITLSGLAGTEEWETEVVITCRSVGASGTVETIIDWEYETTTGSSAIERLNVAGVLRTIDTTASGALDVTFQWGTAAAANTLHSHVGFVEILN